MFTRIEAPKFRVGKFVLNEYELRQLQLEVALGIKSGPFVVKDMKGKTAKILEHCGLLSDTLYGMTISDNIAMRIFSINNHDEVKKAEYANYMKIHGL